MRHHRSSHPDCEAMTTRPNHRAPLDAGRALCYISSVSGATRVSADRWAIAIAMNYIFSRKAHEIGAAFLTFLLLTSDVMASQYVDATFQVEATSWGNWGEHRKTCTGHCIFGTNEWLIEGEFSQNAKEIWWCTGTNILTRTLITKDMPETPATVGPATTALHACEQFSGVFGPEGIQPLIGIANVSWLAFCSGSFLKADGRKIMPPFPAGRGSDAYSDKTQVFPDDLGLPKRVEIYEQSKSLTCLYQVLQSTNFSGWMVPVRFELTQQRDSKPWWRVSVTVTALRESTEPRIPNAR